MKRATEVQKGFLVLVTAGLLFCSVFSRAQQQSRRADVDYTADVVYPVKIGLDSSVVCLVGNVMLHHNGAVLTCDSAVRYSPDYFEFFHRVVVNKDSIYVYGDKADYNGLINTARIYAPIIKVVDGDITMYTYRFAFDTERNAGEFGGGATVLRGTERLESQRGYYYADTKEVVCVDEVEIETEEYLMKSDSVCYNMDTEMARFFDNTYIWNRKGEILSATSGIYEKPEAVYHFTSDAYILTDKQEMWSDTLDYRSRERIAVMRNDIQVNDDEHESQAFGDYGHYWGGDFEHGRLTRLPSVIGYDRQNEDTVYMRSDTITIHSVDKSFFDAYLVQPEDDKSEEDNGEVLLDDSAAVSRRPAGEERAATVATPSNADAKKRKRAEKEARKSRKKGRNQAVEEPAASADRADDTPVTVADGGLKVTVPDSVAVVLEMRAVPAVDSVAELLQPIPAQRPVAVDSTGRALLAMETAKKADDGEAKPERIVRAYRNVKIAGRDYQAVCDSVVAMTIDSTAHMYIDPVLWSGANQISSQVVDIYSVNRQIERAEFTGSPMMVSEVDDTHYNQVAGKVIIAYFRDNKIFRTDVNANARTLYYHQEKGKRGLSGFTVSECANITFRIVDNQVRQIAYFGKHNFAMYPMDKIPETQPQFLDGFRWEGSRRPTVEEIFDRQIRPSRRREYETMDKPRFSITERIDRHREELIRSGSWQDRNDQLSEEVLDYIRSL